MPSVFKEKFFNFSRDYNDFEPLIYQAACLVHLYASHGIDPVVLAFEIDETLRLIPKQRGIKWLYYNAIKVALKDRESTMAAVVSNNQADP